MSDFYVAVGEKTTFSKTVDPRLFAPKPMGLTADLDRQPPRYRSKRVAAWHADQGRK